MVGKYIEDYPEGEIVEYSSSKKYSSNFWARVLAAALVATFSHISHMTTTDRPVLIRAKLHYTDTGYEHHQQTKICHIPTS